MPSYFVTDTSGDILVAYQGPEEGAPTNSILVEDQIYAQASLNIKGYTFLNNVLLPIISVALPEPSLSQQALLAIDAGVTLSLSGSITLPPTLFPCDNDTTSKIGTVLNIYDVTGAFPGGGTSYHMKDMASPPVWHTFTGPQYSAVVLAISNYVAPLYLISDGFPGLTVLPNPVIPTLNV